MLKTYESINQAIQDVDVFISSLEQIWRNFA